MGLFNSGFSFFPASKSRPGEKVGYETEYDEIKSPRSRSADSKGYQYDTSQPVKPFDHIVSDKYHRAINVEVKEGLEALELEIWLFAKKHFSLVRDDNDINEAGQGANQLTIQNMLIADTMFDTYTNKIYEDHIVGRHNGRDEAERDCRPPARAALLRHGTFRKNFIMGILGNVLVEQILDNQWIGWETEDKETAMENLSNDGAKDDDLATKHNLVAMKLNLEDSVERTFKDSKSTQEVHERTRAELMKNKPRFGPSLMQKQTDHLTAAIWVHLKIIYALCTNYSLFCPIPQHVAKDLEHLVVQAGSLSSKMAYDSYTVYEWTEPSNGVDVQGIMKGLRATSLRYDSVGSQGSMAVRHCEVISTPWTCKLPTITSGEISEVEVARLIRPKMQVGCCANGHRGVEERSKAHEGLREREYESVDDTIVVARETRQDSVSRGSAGSGIVPMGEVGSHDAPARVGEEQIQEELVGQYRSGHLP